MQDVLAAPASAEEGEVPFRDDENRPTFLPIVDMDCQHDLIFPFQGNIYKQCIVTVGNMAKAALKTTNSCSDELPKSQERWRASHWSRQQHGDPATGEAISFHCLDAQNTSRWGCFFVCSIGSWELIFFALSQLLELSKMGEFQQVGVNWHCLICVWDPRYEPLSEARTQSRLLPYWSMVLLMSFDITQLQGSHRSKG